MSIPPSYVHGHISLGIKRVALTSWGGQGVNGSRKWLAVAEGAAMDRWRQRQQQGSWTLMHVPCWNAIWKKQGAYGLIAWRFIPHSRLYTPCSRPRRSFGWWGPEPHACVFESSMATCPRDSASMGFFFFFIKWGRQKLGRLMDDPGCTRID